jgi:DNA-binding response OmpR family regulator
MNRVDRPNSPIDLAHVPDFPLGGVQVRPSSREVEGASWKDALEPRLMQVLVALAQAGGAVVSRDDLIQRWRPSSWTALPLSSTREAATWAMSRWFRKTPTFSC